MATCVVCGKSIGLLAGAASGHYKEYRCGVCGSLVGDGCFERSSNGKGEELHTCLKCAQDGKRAERPTGGMLAQAGREVADEWALKFRGEGDRLLDRADERARKLLNETDERAHKLVEHLRAETDQAAERFVQHVEKALERRAKEEVRTAVLLFFIMASAVAVTGALSLLFAWLHKVVL
ncbi:MAG: hypothetical protein M5U26_02145 [Planctomycetota bacterium]|nr:hypothetical protein [Planctomycetota bacterium]